MTVAPKMIKVKSATFAGKAIPFATNADYAFQGSSQMGRGNGAVAMQIAYVEGVHAAINIACLEASSDTDLIYPKSGALVIVGFEQAQGSGDNTADKTYTFPVVTSEGVRQGLPLDGNPTITRAFIGVAPSGLVADIMAIS